MIITVTTGPARHHSLSASVRVTVVPVIIEFCPMTSSRGRPRRPQFNFKLTSRLRACSAIANLKHSGCLPEPARASPAC